MFSKITLKNFRSFDNIVFDLSGKNKSVKPLAIIFGENGAGKSNLATSFVLLSELLNTMNVRDIYQELINEMAKYDNPNLGEIMRSHLRDIQAIINDYRMIDNSEPLIAEYNFVINGKQGKYIIELSNSEIIHERLEFLLSKRKGIYFDCTPNKISINNDIFTSEDFYENIKETAKKYWGKHSILAIIKHEIFDKTQSYALNNISENFKRVIAEFDLLSAYNIKIGTREWSELFTPLTILEEPITGKIDNDKLEELELVESIISSFFSSISPNIKRAFYRVNNKDDKLVYNLYFEKKIAGCYKEIPFYKESTGNHQVLQILCYVISACLGNTVVIDEADSGIHDVLFCQIIQEIEPLIAGQLIMTTHNTMLMDTTFAREATYILKIDENGSKEILSISDFPNRTYANNSIRNKYLNNHYEGIPKTSYMGFATLIETIKNFYNKYHS